MGGIFSAPKPPPPPPPPPAPETTAEDDERKRRLEAIARKRRGRLGLIATSPRGLLQENPFVVTRKSLLGE